MSIFLIMAPASLEPDKKFVVLLRLAMTANRWGGGAKRFMLTSRRSLIVFCVAAMQSEKPLSGKSILLVEDQYFIAMDVTQVLSDGGADVIWAASVEEALPVARREKIDAALLDIRLNGTVAPVTKELAAKAIPFAFHTAYASRECEELQCWPMAKVIPKPAKPEAIINTITAIIGVA